MIWSATLNIVYQEICISIVLEIQFGNIHFVVIKYSQIMIICSSYLKVPSNNFVVETGVCLGRLQ